MQSTKSESLAKTQSSKARSYAVIRHALHVNGPLSRSQLAEVTTLKLSSVCGRVNELLKTGELVEAGKIYDKATERNVTTVALNTSAMKAAV